LPNWAKSVPSTVPSPLKSNSELHSVRCQNEDDAKNALLLVHLHFGTGWAVDFILGPNKVDVSDQIFVVVGGEGEEQSFE
jgi:hypothetical protein